MKETIESLQEKLNTCSDMLTDEEYDELVEQIEKLENEIKNNR